MPFPKRQSLDSRKAEDIEALIFTLISTGEAQRKKPVEYIAELPISWNKINDFISVLEDWFVRYWDWTTRKLASDLISSIPTDPNNLWYFATQSDLTTAHPTASAWNYALVGATDSFWVWDDWTNSWIDSWNWISPKTMTTATDPATNTALTTAIVDWYSWIVITTTTTWNSQTFQNPTNLTPWQMFTVVNNDTSTDPIDIIANSQTNTLDPWQGANYLWDWTKRILVDLVSASDITAVPFDTITWTNVQTQLQQINDKILLEKEYTVIDWTSWTATITEFDKIYFITTATNETVLTIPNPVAGNKDSQLRIYKLSWDWHLVIRTVDWTSLIAGYNRQYVHNNNNWFTFISTWTDYKEIQDSVAPYVEEVNSDYLASEDWHTTRMIVNTTWWDVDVQLPLIATLRDKRRQSWFFILINNWPNQVHFDFNWCVSSHPNKRVLRPYKWRLECFWDWVNLYPTEVSSANVDIKPNDISNLELRIDPNDSSTVSDTWWLIDSIDSKDPTWTRQFVWTWTQRPNLVSNWLWNADIMRFIATNWMNAWNIPCYDNTRWFYIACIVKPTWSSDSILTKFDNNPDNRERRMQTNNVVLYEELDWNPRSMVNFTPNYNNWNIYELSWTPWQGVKAYLNWVLQWTGTSIPSIASWTFEVRLWDTEWLSWLNWDVAEFVVYSRDLTDEQKQNIREYLSWKRGLSDIIPVSSQATIWERDETNWVLVPYIPWDKIDLYDSNSTTILFNHNYIHWKDTAITWNLTIDTTWAVMGNTVKIIHNDTVEPTITGATGWVWDQYITWTDNLITITYFSATNIIYSIQEIQ